MQKLEHLKKEEYVPKPIDLSDVELSERILRYAEIVAKNVHEVWAQNRIADGWRYGERLDEDKRTHPCLVAYEDLPESEKRYDRDTALNTIRLLVKLGIEIR